MTGQGVILGLTPGEEIDTALVGAESVIRKPYLSKPEYDIYHFDDSYLADLLCFGDERYFCVSESD